MTQHNKDTEVSLDDHQAAESIEAEAKLGITNPFWRTVVIVLALALVLFHLYTTINGIYPALIQRSIHLGLALTLCYALVPLKKSMTRTKGIPWYDAILMILSLATTLYIPFVYDEILSNPLLWVNNLDKIFSFILLVLIVEAGRRTVGWTFPIMVILTIIYSVFGPYFPGAWGHSGFSFEAILQNLYHSSNGIWGLMLGISATILAIFAIFGATLIAIGAGESFFKISQLITGGSRGGAAKVSIFSSGLFGMISGSAVSNVVTTGNFTIPAMKKSGFSNSFSGAVEAVASTGGQLIPPVLGAGAFIMAQIIGVPYTDIALAAIIPAFLYYLGAYIAIDLESRNKGIQALKKGSKKGDFPIKNVVVFVVPIGIFMYLLFTGYTPALGGVWAIVAGIVLFLLLRPKSAATEEKKKVHVVGLELIIAASRTVLQIAALLACAQIVVSLISMTGLGVKLSSFVIDFANGNLFLALLLTAVVAIVLGMGLPTTAAYVIGASVLGPALIQFGIEPLLAHLFIFYFAVISTITPPVCAAVFLAAALAKANWWKTAIDSIKLALASFIVPFAFVYSDSLLMRGEPMEIVLSTVTAAIGVFFLAVFAIGYFMEKVNVWVRILSLAAGILLVIPNLLFSGLGLALGIIIIIIQLNSSKKKIVEDQVNFNM